MRIPKLYTIKDLAVERKHVRTHEKSEERSKKSLNQSWEKSKLSYFQGYQRELK